MISKALIQEHFPQFGEQELIEEISTHGKLVDFNEGDLLIEMNAYIKSMPLIIEGSIKIIREDEDGNEMLMYYIEGGETCSMSLTCCLSEQRSSIKASAESKGTMIKVPVEFMDEWMVKYKSWKSFVMASYRYRFEELLHTIDCLAFHKMDDRIISYLRNKSEVQNNFAIKITHSEIAKDLNSSREVISRLLKQLEKQGRIVLSRNSIDTTNLI